MGLVIVLRCANVELKTEMSETLYVLFFLVHCAPGSGTNPVL
jgi:hypothetical protein